MVTETEPETWALERYFKTLAALYEIEFEKVASVLANEGQNPKAK